MLWPHLKSIEFRNSESLRRSLAQTCHTAHPIHTLVAQGEQEQTTILCCFKGCIGTNSPILCCFTKGVQENTVMICSKSLFYTFLLTGCILYMNKLSHCAILRGCTETNGHMSYFTWRIHFSMHAL